MRKTKIVCTLGPAVDNHEMIRALVKAGMNVARLNLSHGTHDEHARRIQIVKDIREELGMPVAILLDTKGPEIRVKKFKEGRVVLQAGDKFTLTTRETEGDETGVSVTYADLPKYVKKGSQILINDGLIELKVDSVKNGEDIECTVIYGGELTNSKSLNLPSCAIDMPYLSPTDKSDILFAIAADADYLASSFVRSGDDVKLVRNLLNLNGGENIQLIAKIENRQGVDNIDDIIELSDGIMVARGDMGVEIPFEELPAIQKELIKRCYRGGKKVITATQMLESMIRNPRPTRAETSDVANAVYDGTSALMLSGETAAGAYPIEALKTMVRIATQTETNINFKKRFEQNEYPVVTVTDAVSHSTVAAAFDLDAKAILTISHSGYTTRKVSRFRPRCIIIGATVSKKVYHQLALNWGVMPVLSVLKTSTDELFAHAVSCAKSTGLIKDGDLVITTCGSAVGRPGNTNLMRIDVIN